MSMFRPKLPRTVSNFSAVGTLMLLLCLLLAEQSPAQTLTTLHSFQATSSAVFTNDDGINPEAALLLSGNTFYGTTAAGGRTGNGTVFSIGKGGGNCTVLHDFPAVSHGTNIDGANPAAALIIAGSTLYGTTPAGGSSGAGTVFKVNTDGTGFAVLYTFTGGTDGANPEAALVLSGNTLYGTASAGGSGGKGAIFALNINGTGFTNVYSFTALPPFGSSQINNDGANPLAGLILSGNTLYGTAANGGSGAFGTVFAVNTDGTGFSVLHNFSYADGGNPEAGLVLSGGILYGTTYDGGTTTYGTVFAVSTQGAGFTNLYTFTGSDGVSPVAGLVLSGNTLYGTASSGFTVNDYGVAFALNINGSGYTVLHIFAGQNPITAVPEGASPLAGMVLSGNTLYGTLSGKFDFGGASADGAVFSLNTDATGFNLMHNFAGPTNILVNGNLDGAVP
ncbi:MAG TPA: choice-of-anchor tandem repeat GloVer-containing protein, partial [Verrucomicrobiae bacterium]|nr:choice-of-anchor tandem repeat GloVer-containing protein [Verrucomicrobiae bacterium]